MFMFTGETWAVHAAWLGWRRPSESSPSLMGRLTGIGSSKRNIPPR